MRKILLASLVAIPAALAAANIDLRDGDIHLDQWSGTFATKLNGYYSIVVQTDYDGRSMTAVVIDNDTGKVHCLPQPCN